ncbi:hypothetical protein ACHAW6_003837 [Cyclotella cf. meneghiniana]
MNLIILFRLLYSFLQRKVNELHPYSSSQKKMDNMQHYTFKLHEESQGFIKIITLFSKHKYSRLLMGLTCSPDIAQAIMENNLASTKDADVYVDCMRSPKIGNTTCNSYSGHLMPLARIWIHH